MGIQKREEFKSMTVQELIKELSEYDPKLPVILKSYDDMEHDVEIVSLNDWEDPKNPFVYIKGFIWL